MSKQNKMTASNLAAVFGPNLIWPGNETSALEEVGAIKTFIKHLFAHSDKIF